MIKKLFSVALVAGTLSANAQTITTICGNGTAAYAGDGAQATAAELSNPYDVALDWAGNLYIADRSNNRIRMVNTAGNISTIVGNGTGGYSGDGGAATAAELYLPTAVALDAAGNLYIADMVNNRIRKVNTSGVISTFAGNGTGGYSGDGGAATAAGLFYPTAVAFDAAGNMYISELQNSRIRKVNTSGVISTFAGNGTAGYTGDGSAATAAELNNPNGVAFDAAGNIYIADATNNRIRMVNTAGIISTYAGNGAMAYSGDGGQATAAELYDPMAVALDGAGNLYIADGNNSCIRKVNTSGVISTFAGNGTGGYTGDGGQASVAELYNPTAVAFDASGNLYIADQQNNRIRMVCFSSCATTGINQVTSSNEVSIYPNPASSSLQVTFSGNIQNTTLLITDMLGNTVKQFIIHNSELRMDVSDLADGIYNISIVSNEGVINKRVVITK
ncbi:MAG TPA: T9SS type A sorting domain-containing protein [Bacteroidia bacterium]